MEIKLAMFISENNLPISISDSLLELLRNIFPNDNHLKNVTLGKQKCTNVIRQVLGYGFSGENIKYLRDNKYSIYNCH